MQRNPKPTSPFWSPARLAATAGSLAGLAVLLTITGPGITIDEPLDVRPGRTYVETLMKRGLGFFEPATVDVVFRDNAEHPPLGRWLLGVASTFGGPFEVAMLGSDPRGLYLYAGRLAPAACFALMVALVAHAAARRYGTVAGAGAGFGLAVMPRAFGHGHLGALDTFIAFFWTFAFLTVERSLEGKRPVLGMAGAGLAWGLALLTKIHAWLLVPLVLARTVWKLGARRGLGAFAVWGLVGLSAFVAGWPWLWQDGPGRLARFLGTGANRSAIQVLYFGTVYADKDVPWHYPWFYFLVTVPVGLHALGMVGVVEGWKRRSSDGLPLRVAGTVALLLGLFSTRAPVYDGERLFLMAFPLWAILIGLGLGRAWEALKGLPWGRGALAVALLAQGYGVVAFHPFQLSYYNALVGGLPGAEWLGLELTYWNDAVDPPLLDRLAREASPGESAALAPTLYPGQGAMTTDRGLVAREIVLADQEAAPDADWLIVSRRSAYWPPFVAEVVNSETPVAVRSRQGAWLSALYRLRPPKPVKDR